jgi:hypothetical protein
MLIPLLPFWAGLLKQPAWRHHGQRLQGMAHRLSHTFQAVERPDGGKDMGRIRALLSPSFEEPTRFEVAKHRLKEELLGSSGHKARPKLTQDRAIKTRIGQLQVESVFPVQAHPDRFCRLAVGQALGKLHTGHQGQAPRGEGGLPLGRKKGHKVLILIERSEQITHGQIGIAFGTSGTGDSSRFFRNWADRLGMQCHRCPPTNRYGPADV